MNYQIIFQTKKLDNYDIFFEIISKNFKASKIKLIKKYSRFFLFNNFKIKKNSKINFIYNFIFNINEKITKIHKFKELCSQIQSNIITFLISKNIFKIIKIPDIEFSLNSIDESIYFNNNIELIERFFEIYQKINIRK